MSSKKNTSKKAKSNTQGGQPKGQKKKQSQKSKGNGRMVIAGINQSSQAKTVDPFINYRDNAKSCRVRHREFIGNLVGSSAFKIQQSLQLNPGLQYPFNWLATLANNFDQYRFHSLSLVVKTRCPTTTAGSVIISPDYDSSDAPPVSEAIMTTYAGTLEDAPWKEMRLSLKPSSMLGGMQRKFIRSQNLLPNQDIKTYDSGNIYVAAVDGADFATWGKTWLEYDVEFFDPSVHSNGILASTTIAGGGTISPANPLGTVPTQAAQADGFTIVPGNPSTVNFRQGGDFNIVQSFSGTGITAVPPVTFLNGSAVLTSATALNNTFSIVETIARNVNAGSTLLMGTPSATTITNTALNIVRGISGSMG